MANIFDTKDHTAEFDGEDIKKNKIMGIFAYISWLVLIPLFAAKDSKWARFHANNGLILAILEIGTWVVFGLLGMIPYVGFIFWIIGWTVSAVPIVLSVFGVINAVQGKAKDLPVIGGKIKILK
ncbi:MAG: hypothetical protein IJT49_08445 [Clostridia bacterium]|nr:hypothetical protein [Clostridia bacterium]